MIYENSRGKRVMCRRGCGINFIRGIIFRYKIFQYAPQTMGQVQITEPSITNLPPQTGVRLESVT